MDILTLISVFIIGYLVGQEVLMRKIRREIKETVEKLGINLSSIPDEESIDDEDIKDGYSVLYTELEQGIVLVYDNKTKDFICQGTTLEDAITKSKIKKAKVYHNEKLFYYNNGKVELVS